jgi:hypothetical protein
MQDPPGGVCKWHWQGKDCRYGTACHFKHVRKAGGATTNGHTSTSARPQKNNRAEGPFTPIQRDVESIARLKTLHKPAEAHAVVKTLSATSFDIMRGQNTVYEFCGALLSSVEKGAWVSRAQHVYFNLDMPLTSRCTSHSASLSRLRKSRTRSSADSRTFCSLRSPTQLKAAPGACPTSAVCSR